MTHIAHRIESRSDVSHDYLTVAEVAGLFRISRDCVYKAIKAGELTHKMFSRRAIRIYRHDAIAWFNSGNANLTK